MGDGDGDPGPACELLDVPRCAAEPSCEAIFPDTVFRVNGCAPGFEPCEEPQPVTEGCGG